MAYRFWNRARLTLMTINKHMCKTTDGSDSLGTSRKHSDFITHAGLTQMPDPQATIHFTRVRQRVEETTLGLHD